MQVLKQKYVSILIECLFRQIRKAEDTIASSSSDTNDSSSAGESTFSLHSDSDAYEHSSSESDVSDKETLTETTTSADIHSQQESSDEKEAAFKSESAVMPQTPKAQVPAASKYVFGSAAKSLTSFNAFASAQPKADFSKLSDKTAAGDAVDPDADSKSSSTTSSPSSKNVSTGEENEECKFMVRARLYQLGGSGGDKEESKQWMDKGYGFVKVNEDCTSGDARVLMRAESVLRVLFNVRLFQGMQYEQLQDRNVRFAAIDEGHICHYLIRFKTISEAQSFMLELDAYCKKNVE